MMDVNVTTSSERAPYHEDSFKLVAAKTSVCMLVLALSLIENAIVLVVVKKDYRNRLRTTNSYLIANMSTIDALFALQNLPLVYNNFIMKGHWVLQGHFGMLLCKVDHFFSLISMVTINLTILAIAGDRFCAVYLPFKKIITRRKCFLLIFLSWFISTLFAAPMLYYANLERVAENLTICTIPDQRVLKIWYIVLTGILITTLIMMSVWYSAIGVKIRRQKFQFNFSQRALRLRERRNRDILKMVVILIIVFYICSLPLLVLQMSRFLGFYTEVEKNHGVFIAVVMMFMNGVINPIIYFTFNSSFREGLKVTMGKCGPCRSSTYAESTRVTTSRRVDRRPAPTKGLSPNCKHAKQGDRKNGVTSVNPLESKHRKQLMITM